MIIRSVPGRPSGRPPGRLVRAAGQALLGAALLFTGTAHLTTLRQEFRAQVPSWFPLDADLVVVGSGVVELVLGAALLLTWRQPARRRVGWVVAAFFVAVFPGNIAQFVEGNAAFGLDSDLSRGVRLLFQPVLVLWALAVTWPVGERARRAQAPASPPR